MRWLNGVLSLDGTLSTKKKELCAQFFIFACVCGLATALNLMASIERQLSQPMALVGTVLVLLGCSTAICAVLCRVPLTTRVVVGTSYMVSCGMLMWDLNARTFYNSHWPLLVLIIDMLLVMQVPTRYSLGLVGFIVIWLSLLGLEESFRFGLFDLPGLAPLHGKYGRLYFLKEQYACDAQPCPKPFPDATMIAAISVFAIDFMMTRGFAREVLKEQASMERTINAVQEIASLLARYDVEKVAELLAEHEHELPVGMTVALRALEENLRSYKAYLPKTCLLEDEDSEVECTQHVGTEQQDCAEQTASSESSSTNGSLPAVSVRHVALGLSTVKATLLTVNIKDTLRLVEHSAHFSSFFTTLLLKTLQATESYRGMVDVFVGDRVHCSFNTSRQCANHATSALHTATMLLRGLKLSQVNIGVATGKVLRGDMGCEVMRRFSMVGTLVRDVHGMERAGRILGCDVLCNRTCFSEAECEHEMRLIPCKVEVSATSDTPEVVAELLPAHTPADADHPDEEWMYTIEQNSEWENYNTTVRKYLKGDVSAAAVEEAAQGCPCERSPLNVHPSTVKGGLLSVALARPLRGEREGMECSCRTFTGDTLSDSYILRKSFAKDDTA